MSLPESSLSYLTQKRKINRQNFPYVFVGSVRYWYILKIDSSKVYNEKLYYYTTNQPTLIFNRELNGGNHSSSLIRLW